ncbi:MAG: hypothetical protein NVS4B12_13670 [Ktedonobacteraceae bacterium]
MPPCYGISKNVLLICTNPSAMLRHIEERIIDLYQSLNTEPARTMAKEKFNNTLAFLDGVIEHLSDATPI